MSDRNINCKSVTKRFGLLGEKLSHSFSPTIHSLLGDYEYRLYEKAPEELEDFLKNGDFDGLNVTIPYKKAVIPYCASLSEVAKRTGSVNTILRGSDGTLHGHNTDYYGFKYMLGQYDYIMPVCGKKALILGSGGASNTVRAVLEDKGASEIVVISRTGENNYQNIERHRDARILVNTTPVGMYPDCDASPVNLRDFQYCTLVVDLIYNPAKTTLLLDAEDLGIVFYNGLLMLVAQAKEASELFQGRAIPDHGANKIEERVELDMLNIVLIGMPGCGKTSIGARLAELTGREFFDTDAMVEQMAKKPVPEIIRTDGEEAFRRLETAALAEVSSKSCCVISTGGGIVERPENRRLIERNGASFFLERDIDELTSEGRPLSQETGIEALAAKRLPLYRQWASCTVPVSGVNETALRIKRMQEL